MKNQFFYKRKEQTSIGEGGVPIYTEFLDSFSIDKVVRTMDYGDKGRVVILDDFHEELRDVPEIHPKTRKPTGNMKKERTDYCSEILLTKEDGDKFVQLNIL